MFDPGPLQLRTYCRNPACRKRLPQPVGDKLDAFCDEPCRVRYGQFNCPVCDRPLNKRDRQRRRRFCSEKCKSAYHRDPGRFERLFTGAARGIAGATRSALKNPDISKAKSPDFGALPLRIIAGPDVHPANLRIPFDPGVRPAKPTSLFGPSDWPANLIGGDRRGLSLDPALRRHIIATELPRLIKGEAND